MVLITSKTYPEGETYKGSAIQETSHFEFLKTYSVTEAVNNIITSVERAAYQEGRILLRIDIDYTSGILYHEFNVTYKYYIPAIAGMALMTGKIESMSIKNMPLPVIAPLLPVIIPLLTAIAYYFLVTTSLKEVKEIIYGPPGAPPSIIPKVALAAVILFGAGYVLTALPPAVKALKEKR